MLYYIDTHAHLYLSQFDDDREEVVSSAVHHRVNKILLPNIDNSTIEQMLAMEVRHRDVCHAMMGLHPCSVDATYREQLQVVRDWIDKRDFIAIGEIGTDLYWDKSFQKEQEQCFRTQISWAIEKNLPIVIHSRETLDWNIEIVAEMYQQGLTGVFHCFTGTIEQAERIAALGFKMGIGGVLTFRNSGLDEVVREISLTDVVLETDSPYLTPAPLRGKRNQSSYVPIIAEKLAVVKGVTVEKVMAATTENALSVFGHIS